MARKLPEKRLPPPKPAVKARKKPLPRLPDDDGELDDDVDEQQARPTRRMAPGDRQQAELAAALQAKLTGKPVFAFPPELKEEHKPYWTEVVNSKPHDYFNMGDLHLLKLYCRVAADIDRLDREVADEGSVVYNGRGSPIVNPRVVVRSYAETRLLSLSTRLRMQPSSRYDSEQDRNQADKKRKADNAVRAIDDDDDDLIARGGSGWGGSASVN